MSPSPFGSISPNLSMAKLRSTVHTFYGTYTEGSEVDHYFINSGDRNV